MKKVYTVIGLWVDDEPLVAGVIEGDHELADTESSSGGHDRWATGVEAYDHEDAEILAVRMIRGEDDEDED